MGNLSIYQCIDSHLHLISRTIKPINKYPVPNENFISLINNNINEKQKTNNFGFDDQTNSTILISVAFSNKCRTTKFTYV